MKLSYVDTLNQYKIIYQAAEIFFINQEMNTFHKVHFKKPSLINKTTTTNNSGFEIWTGRQTLMQLPSLWRHCTV